MTKHLKTLTLTGPMKRRLESLHYQMTCYRCGNPIQTGEQFISKRKIGSSSSHKYYHENCWESMFIE